MKYVLAYLMHFMSVTNGYTGDLPPQEIYCAAHAVYHEARNQPMVGQVSVAHVVFNRVKDSRHPDNACDVVYEKDQFTDLYPQNRIDNKKAWVIAIEAATLAYTGFVDDFTRGSTLYHNPVTAPNPRWDFSKLAYRGDIKDHRFYKEL